LSFDFQNYKFKNRIKKFAKAAPAKDFSASDVFAKKIKEAELNVVEK